MWEVLLSLYRLRSREQQAVFGPWRRQVAPLVPDSTRLLTALAPAHGYAADFLTPATHSLSLLEHTEALRRTPRTRLQIDVERFTRLHPRRRTPGWFTELAAGRAWILDEIAQAAETYFQRSLALHWEHIRAQVDHDRMRRGCLLAERGWAALFPSLHPSAHWDYPVLELAYPTQHTVDLNGRGLLLQPSFFCAGAPTVLADEDLPPVLAYPIDHTLGWAVPVGHGDGDRPLAAVLGRTRARLLRTIVEAPGTTTDIARRLRIPPSTASRQLTALREAGLANSHRNGNQVIHTSTRLGVALLHNPTMTKGDATYR